MLSLSPAVVVSTIREALSGSTADLTAGDLRRAIILLAIPMILEMLMESLFGIVDMFFVARLGVDALAAVALTETIVVLVFGIAMGLSMATTAFVARRIGEKDPDGAAIASVQAITVGLLLSIVVGAAGIFYAPDLLALMGATDAVIRTGAAYTRILLGGSITIFLLFLINAIFRGAGDAALAMRALWIANLINMILDACLINGWGLFPRWGVTGASVATTTGRSIGVIFQLWMLSGGFSRVRLHAHQIRINVTVLWQLLKVSFTAILQNLISSASWTSLVRLCATFGIVPVAGYMIAIRVFLFVLLPAWGLSGAVATLTGQSLGAKKPERAEAAVYLTGRYATWYMGIVAALCIVFARPIAAFFTADPAVQNAAADSLRFISIGDIFYAWGMVLTQTFDGAGDTMTPFVINFFAYWCFQIPLAWTLAVALHWGPRGVFTAVPAAEALMTISLLVMFRRGAWKRKVI